MSLETNTAPAVDLTLEQAGALAPLIDPRQAVAKVAAGAVLIDVRSAAGRSAAGSISGAAIVDRYRVDDLFDLASTERLPQIAGPDTPVVVVCGSVRGSGPVAAALIAKGFTDVAHVEGGFPAWAAAGLPTDPPAAELD